MVPLIYKEANYALAVDYPSGQRVSGPISQTRFGLGDIKLEPLLLAWHWDQWDLMTAGAVWVPTGHHITTSGDNLGDGNWSPMATLGAVWHPDEARTWSLSILNHYEFNCQQTDGYFHYIRQPPFPRITYGFENSPSSTYTLECAVGKTVFDHTDVGVSGYYQQQFTDGYDRYNLEKDSSVTGAGPEVSVNIPGWDLTASLRYDYEFAAHDRPRGNVIDLSVTKRF